MEKKKDERAIVFFVPRLWSSNGCEGIENSVMAEWKKNIWKRFRKAKSRQTKIFWVQNDVRWKHFLVVGSLLSLSLQIPSSKQLSLYPQILLHMLGNKGSLVWRQKTYCEKKYELIVLQKKTWAAFYGAIKTVCKMKKEKNTIKVNVNKNCFGESWESGKKERVLFVNSWMPVLTYDVYNNNMINVFGKRWTV